MLHLCDTFFTLSLPQDPPSPYPTTFPRHDGTAPGPKLLPILFPSLTDAYKVLTESYFFLCPSPASQKHAQGAHQVRFLSIPSPALQKHAQGAHLVMQVRRAPGQCAGEAERLGAAIRAADLHGQGGGRGGVSVCISASLSGPLLLRCSGQTAKQRGSTQKRTRRDDQGCTPAWAGGRGEGFRERSFQCTLAPLCTAAQTTKQGGSAPRCTRALVRAAKFHVRGAL